MHCWDLEREKAKSEPKKGRALKHEGEKEKQPCRKPEGKRTSKGKKSTPCSHNAALQNRATKRTKRRGRSGAGAWDTRAPAPLCRSQAEHDKKNERKRPQARRREMNLLRHTNIKKRKTERGKHVQREHRRRTSKVPSRETTPKDKNKRKETMNWAPFVHVCAYVCGCVGFRCTCIRAHATSARGGNAQTRAAFADKREKGRLFCFARTSVRPSFPSSPPLRVHTYIDCYMRSHNAQAQQTYLPAHLSSPPSSTHMRRCRGWCEHGLSRSLVVPPRHA